MNRNGVDILQLGYGQCSALMEEASRSGIAPR